MDAEREALVYKMAGVFLVISPGSSAGYGVE